MSQLILPHTITAGTPMVASDVQTNDEAIRDVINGQIDDANLASVPQVKVTTSADISITSGTETALVFDTEPYDAASMHSPTTNPSRLTIVRAGLYDLGAYASFLANATGRRYIRFRVNGTSATPFDARQAITDGGQTAIMIPWQHRFVVGDFIELITFQSSGGTLAVTAGASMWAAWRSI